MKSKYGISIDIDWAPDEVIQYTLDLLSEFQVKATLFMTHKIDCDVKEHEVAIHPNFTSLDFEKHIAERLDDFPNAKGTRSHSLFFSERLREVYDKYNIQYQSNAMMHLQKEIKPFFMAPDTVELPFFMMDTFYIIMKDHKANFNVDELGLKGGGLKIFDFHPVHIYLNTEKLSRYHDVKQYYHQPKELLRARNTQTRGTKDFFIDILQFIRSTEEKSSTLLEMNKEFRAQ